MIISFTYVRLRSVSQPNFTSDVNKDLTLKAKAKAKDRTFEGLNRELDI